MVSPETLRRFPFFGGLTLPQITKLAAAAQERTVTAGTPLFPEGETLTVSYLVLAGEVAITMEMTARGAHHPVAAQLTGQTAREGVHISTVGVGEVFGWSALLPPFTATAGAVAATDARLVAFDGEQLRRDFETDCEFGFLMMQKVAQVVRERLQALRVESLAHWVA